MPKKVAVEKKKDLKSNRDSKMKKVSKETKPSPDPIAHGLFPLKYTKACGVKKVPSTGNTVKYTEIHATRLQTRCRNESPSQKKDKNVKEYRKENQKEHRDVTILENTSAVSSRRKSLRNIRKSTRMQTECRQESERRLIESPCKNKNTKEFREEKYDDVASLKIEKDSTVRNPKVSSIESAFKNEDKNIKEFGEEEHDDDKPHDIDSLQIEKNSTIRNPQVPSIESPSQNNAKITETNRGCFLCAQRIIHCKNKNPKKFVENKENVPRDFPSFQIEKNLTTTFSSRKSLPDIKKPTVEFKMEPFPRPSTSGEKTDLKENIGEKDLESTCYDDGAQVSIKLLNTPHDSFVKDLDALKKDLLAAFQASVEKISSNEEPTPRFKPPSGKKLADFEEAIKSAAKKSFDEDGDDEYHALGVQITYYNLTFFFAVRKSM